MNHSRRLRLGPEVYPHHHPQPSHAALEDCWEEQEERCKCEGFYIEQRLCDDIACQSIGFECFQKFRYPFSAPHKPYSSAWNPGRPFSDILHCHRLWAKSAYMNGICSDGPSIPFSTEKLNSAIGCIMRDCNHRSSEPPDPKQSYDLGSGTCSKQTGATEVPYQRGDQARVRDCSINSFQQSF
jgi:hypothetical protein